MERQNQDVADDRPIACTLSERDLAVRRELVNAELFQNGERVEELPDGYAYRFPGTEASLDALLDFIAAERRCCSFFTFELVFEPAEGPIWLRLRGSAAIKAFVRETFTAPLAASDAART